MNNLKVIAVALTVATLTACSTYGSHSSYVELASDGVLTANKGMTLYTFDKDVSGSGKSVCNGPCAVNWPPLLVSHTDIYSGEYSVVTREDSKLQLAYKGKPLYFWSKDQQPGDKTGDGFNNVWHVAKP